MLFKLPQLKSRRGSLLLVITFAVTMGIVAFSMLVMASNLYTASRNSAAVYESIQSYRSATEIATYQYITDLQAVEVTRNLDADWISVSGNAIYTQALDAITGALSPDGGRTAWHVTDIRQAIRGANLSNPAVLVDLLGLLSNANQSFQLEVPAPLRLDWDNPESSRDRNSAVIAIEPFLVEVNLQVRGEKIFESFIIDGVFLHVDLSKQQGSKATIATMRLGEGKDGVIISRAPLTY